jgi:hypothetical protein
MDLGRSQRGDDGDGEVSLRARALERTLDEIGHAIGEILPAARQSLQRRGFADPQRIGDVSNRSLLVVVEHEDFPVGLGHSR